MVNIKNGTESLIYNNINDKFRLVLADTYDKIKSLGLKYYDKRSITKNEFIKDFDKIVKDFEEETIKRFNIKVSLRNSNTFAVMPIFNNDTFGIFKLSKNKDAVNAMRQLKTFSKYLESNVVTIDLKEVKIYNLPKDFYFPLFINVQTIVYDLDSDEFSGVVMHEIGHIFTLMELYTSSVKSTTSLLNSLLKNDDLNMTIEKLDITSNKELTDKEKSVMIYEHLTGSMKLIELASNRHYDNTDVEYNADNFAVKFGYGDSLVKVLNKLTKVRSTSYNMLFVIGVYKIFMSMLTSMLVLCFITNIFTLLSLTIFFVLLDLMYSIANLTINKRNPTGNIHGDLMTRAKRIKTSMISILRANNLSKDELKLMIKQLDSTNKELEILDKSIMDSIFGGLINKTLSVNLNLQDSLANTLDSLVNNNLYVSSAKFDAGLESVSYMGKKHPVVKKLNTVFKNITDKNLVTTVATIYAYLKDIETIVYEEFGIPTVVMPSSTLVNIVGDAGWFSVPFNFIQESALSNNVTLMSQSRLTISNLFVTDVNSRLLNALKKKDIIIDKNKNKIFGLDRLKHKTIIGVELGRDDLFMTYGLSPIALTPEEMTAVILHEIGHLFTYIDAMTKSVRTNIMLQEYFLDATKVSKVSKITYDDRFKEVDKRFNTVKGTIYGNIISYLTFSILQIESIAGLALAGSPISIMLDRSANKNNLGNYVSYSTDSEVVADNFATMYGVGAELTSGLTRLQTLNIKSKFLIVLPLLYHSFVSTIRGMVFNWDFSKLNSGLPKLILLSFIGSMTIWFSYFISRVILNDDFPYEKLPERFDSIKRSILKIVREEKLPKTEKKNILEALEIIDKNIKSVIDSGYASIILSMFIPSPNMGIILKPEKELMDILDKMINNDMYELALKFEVGLEASKHFLKDVTVFYTEENINKTPVVYLDKLLTKSSVKLINKALSKYNISIEYKRYVISVKSNINYKIRSGISGFALVPVYDNGIDKVISLTLETDKIAWHLANPHINVYNIDTVQLSDIKYIYIEEMDNLPDLTSKINHKTKKIDKVIAKIWEVLDEYYDNYGRTNNIGEIDILLKIKDLPKELNEQLLLLKNMIIENENTDYSGLDLHSGNVSYKDGKYILLDPLYNPNRLGHKQSNYITVDKSKLALKQGTESLTLNNKKKCKYNKDEPFIVYHFGKSGYEDIRPLALQDIKNIEEHKLYKMLGKEKFKTYFNEVNTFINDISKDEVKNLIDNGFKNWDVKDLTKYEINLDDNKDKIDSISITSIPDTSEWYSKHWDDWYEKHKDLNDKEYVKAKEELRDRMLNELKLTTTFKSIEKFQEYANNKDWCDNEKFVEYNIENGFKSQYASYIPHIQITVNAPLTISKSTRVW